MCNRYRPARAGDLLPHVYIGQPPADWRADVAVGPRATVPIVRPREGQLEEVFGQWGMIRPGSPERVERDAKNRPRMTNNARSETMAKLPTFRQAWSSGQRCLLPAWSYDEPNWESGKNVWWTLRRADGRAMAIAGLWSEWTDPATGEVVVNCTMPTINVNSHPLLNRLHRPELDPQTKEPLPLAQQDKRAVVALDPTHWQAWLHGTSQEALAVLLVMPPDAFNAGPVNGNPATPQLV